MENTSKAPGLYDKFVDGAGFVGGVLIVLTALSVGYEIIMRYFFNAPTTWTMEMGIYAIIASTFLSLAYALKEKAHVKVDFITAKLSGGTAIILEIFTCLLSIVYCLILTWKGIEMIYFTFQKWEVSPTVLNVPLVFPQFFIPFGGLLLTVQFARITTDLYKSLRTERANRSAQGAKPCSSVSECSITFVFAALLIAGAVLLKVSMNTGLLILFFVTLLSGLPVAVALGLFGVFGFYFLFGGADMLVQVPLMAYSSLDTFVMVALPLFILTSNILRNGDVGILIYRFANSLVRHLPGGLGIASIIFCGLFAAMTGSSVAVAAAVSLIALPEMLSRGYPRPLTIGLLAAGGTLGILFPPSLAMIIYGSMTTESIGSLFMAGLIPGLILSGMFCVYVLVVGARAKGIQRETRASFKEIMTATRHAAGGLITIVIIIGGIYSGVFTPTEAGGIAGVYTLFLCLFSRSLSLKKLKLTILDTARISAMIMLIIIGANITGQVILMAQISQNILAAVKAMDLSPWLIVIFINIFLIIMGMPLESISILVITLPILYPIVTGLGFSGLWFAVIMVINMEMALISPPEGINLFILQNLAKSTAAEVTKGVWPFLVIMAIFLVLISCFPGLTTWMPSLIAP